MWIARSERRVSALRPSPKRALASSHYLSGIEKRPIEFTSSVRCVLTVIDPTIHHYNQWPIHHEAYQELIVLLPDLEVRLVPMMIALEVTAEGWDVDTVMRSLSFSFLNITDHSTHLRLPWSFELSVEGGSMVAIISWVMWSKLESILWLPTVSQLVLCHTSSLPNSPLMWQVMVFLRAHSMNSNSQIPF